MEVVGCCTHVSFCALWVSNRPKVSLFLAHGRAGGGVRRCSAGFWVYSDESKNREAKQIWQACSKGSPVYPRFLLRLQWFGALQAFLFGNWWSQACLVDDNVSHSARNMERRWKI